MVAAAVAAEAAEAPEPEPEVVAAAAEEIVEAPAEGAGVVAAEKAAEVVVEPAEVPVEEEEAVAPSLDELDLDEEQLRFLGRKLDQVKDIDPGSAEKLSAAGLNTVYDLLSKGATRKGRETLAVLTGISSQLILRWVNNADMFRVRGIGTQYADLLEAAGVDTVVELAQRNPANLFAKLTEVNEEKKLVQQIPTLSQVEAWVAGAKDLPRVVRY